jgi:hypothetical protein
MYHHSQDPTPVAPDSQMIWSSTAHHVRPGLQSLQLLSQEWYTQGRQHASGTCSRCPAAQHEPPDTAAPYCESPTTAAARCSCSTSSRPQLQLPGVAAVPPVAAPLNCSDTNSHAARAARRQGHRLMTGEPQTSLPCMMAARHSHHNQSHTLHCSYLRSSNA